MVRARGEPPECELAAAAGRSAAVAGRKGEGKRDEGLPRARSSFGRTRQLLVSLVSRALLSVCCSVSSTRLEFEDWRLYSG